jgi:3-oxoacyl-[acyl-carrier protein] reductase
MNLRKKVVLITGIGKGIGNQIFFDCLDNADFTYGILRNKNDLVSIKKKIKSKKCKIILGDISNKNTIKNVIKHSLKNKIKINCLVNNAGERQRENFLNLSEKKIYHIFEKNFFSHFFLTQKIVNQFCKENKGILSIVNIGSIVGIKGFSQLTGYASTKQALDAFTKSLAIEMADKKKNVRGNIVHPGFIKTSYYENFKKKRKKLYNWTLSKIPTKKWGNSSDISNLVCFLLSDESRYINGQSIICDGGWTIG